MKIRHACNCTCKELSKRPARPSFYNTVFRKTITNQQSISKIFDFVRNILKECYLSCRMHAFEGTSGTFPITLCNSVAGGGGIYGSEEIQNSPLLNYRKHYSSKPIYRICWNMGENNTCSGGDKVRL